MSRKIGVVMDPIETINYKKDTTLGLLWAARDRGWSLFYMQQKDLYLAGGIARAKMRPLEVREDPTDYYSLGDAEDRDLNDLDIIFMRKDPPFDMEFVYTTQLLENAERRGTLIVNRCASLRDCNEKLFATQFPQCCPTLIVSRDMQRLRAFHAEHGDVIFKPLDGMGGSSIFRAKADDSNVSVILETLTQHGTQTIMGQVYLPLSTRDQWIAAQVGPALREKGLWFVGLDVIGDYLTEINVTSPTCLREIEREQGLGIANQLMDCIDAQLGSA